MFLHKSEAIEVLKRLRQLQRASAKAYREKTCDASNLYHMMKEAERTADQFISDYDRLN